MADNSKGTICLYHEDYLLYHGDSAGVDVPGAALRNILIFRDLGSEFEGFFAPWFSDNDDDEDDHRRLRPDKEIKSITKILNLMAEKFEEV